MRTNRWIEVETLQPRSIGDPRSPQPAPGLFSQCKSVNSTLEDTPYTIRMRTSKVSQETSKIFNATSPNPVRRSTRQAVKTISAFTLGHDGSKNVKLEDPEGSSLMEPALETALSTDIEDSLTTPRSMRKRNRGSDSPATTTTIVTSSSKTQTSPRKRLKPDPDDTKDDPISPSTPSSRAGALPKTPARKTTLADGTVQTHPPSNWESLYDTVKAMRLANPTAPVDTMGCEDLHWRASPPQEQRYHTLTALMLSSQTKDTVTAAAMQRLHTELIPQSPASTTTTSTLTIPNILATTPAHLNSLINKVGFHNKKTTHIRLTAALLQQHHNSDVPSTLPALLRLPGVGPKMAYLTLSAAWSIDAGIGVDVHVHRITNRWGWHATRTAEETRRALEGWLPRERWHEINRLLVGLGQTVCLPVGRRCGECALAGTGLCKGEVRGWKAAAKKGAATVRKEVMTVDKEDEGEVAPVKEEEGGG